MPDLDVNDPNWGSGAISSTPILPIEWAIDGIAEIADGLNYAIIDYGFWSTQTVKVAGGVAGEVLLDRTVGKFIPDNITQRIKETILKSSKNLPGPNIPEYHLGNFTDNLAKNRQVSGDEIFYKYHGKGNRLGKTHNYVTKKQYSTEEELRNDLAILDEWGVDIDRITTFKPPKGSWVSEGDAAGQVGDFTDELRAGGGYQGLIDIKNLPKSSLLRTDKLPEGFK
jgi:hypothetical protein